MKENMACYMNENGKIIYMMEYKDNKWNIGLF